MAPHRPGSFLQRETGKPNDSRAAAAIVPWERASDAALEGLWRDCLNEPWRVAHLAKRVMAELAGRMASRRKVRDAEDRSGVWPSIRGDHPEEELGGLFDLNA